jgi:hypothetical protein
MGNNAVINSTLEELLGVMDARANVNIFRQLKDGKQELLRSNKIYNIISDQEFFRAHNVCEAKVIGLLVSFGFASILIEEA